MIGSANVGTFSRSSNTIDGSDATGTASLQVDLSQNSLVVLGTSVGNLKFSVENFSNVIGTSQDDDIVGNNQNNRLIGGRGNDKVSGLAGKDTLIGVDPNSFRPGFSELDILTGGADADLFVLGDGNQAYYLGNRSEDLAIITDFESGLDKIQLNGSIDNYFFLGSTSIFRQSFSSAATEDPFAFDKIVSFDLVGTVARGFNLQTDFVFTNQALA